MRRKFKPIDPNELIDADDINKTTMKGEMRKLWPAIHQKLSQGGWSARDIVKWLDERGICMSVELFRVYLRNIDLEQGYDRSKNKFDDAQNKQQSASMAPPDKSAKPSVREVEQKPFPVTKKSSVKKNKTASPQHLCKIISNKFDTSKYRNED